MQTNPKSRKRLLLHLFESAGRNLCRCPWPRKLFNDSGAKNLSDRPHKSKTSTYVVMFFSNILVRCCESFLGMRDTPKDDAPKTQHVSVVGVIQPSTMLRNAHRRKQVLAVESEKQ